MKIDYLSRASWGARAATRVTRLPTQPATTVFVHHGASGVPTSLKDLDGDGAPDGEELVWKSYQRYHMDTKGWTDIAYSHGVGQSGWAYEGRGWTRQGGATGSPEDTYSISICAIGNFEKIKPTNKMIKTITKLITFGIREGHLVKQPKIVIVGHKDRPASTSCPGRHLYARLDEIRDGVQAATAPALVVPTAEVEAMPIDEWFKIYNQLPDGAEHPVVGFMEAGLKQLGYYAFKVNGVKTSTLGSAWKVYEQDTNPAQHPANEKPGGTSWRRFVDAYDESSTDIRALKSLVQKQGGILSAISNLITGE